MKTDKIKAILDTAADLFARYGFRKTNIEDIAHIARVAKATIYNHLGNKEQVYLEVLRREMKDVIDNISSHVIAETSPSDKLIAFVKSRFVYTRKAVNILNMYRDTEENLLPDAMNVREELFKQEVDLLSGILEEGKIRGVFFLNYPALTAGAVMHSIKGFELNWLVYQDETKIENYLDEFISIFFYGVLDRNRPQRQHADTA